MGRTHLLPEFRQFIALVRLALLVIYFSSPRMAAQLMDDHWILKLKLLRRYSTGFPFNGWDYLRVLQLSGSLSYQYLYHLQNTPELYCFKLGSITIEYP